MKRLAWALFTLSFLTTIVWIVEGWFVTGSFFGHGPLLLGAALWFLWERRSAIRAAPSEPDRRAVIWLLACLFLHLSAQSLMIASMSGAILVPAMLCLVWLLEGRSRLRLVAAPLCCLLFAVPLPLFVSGQMSYELKHIATAGAVMLGNVFGLGLVQDGSRIVIPGQPSPLLVGDACSGLRSIVALLSLAYLFAFFLTPRKLAGKLMFLGLALPLAIVVNVIRITSLAGLAKHYGIGLASGTAHDVSGYLIYAGAIALLAGLDRVLPGRLPRRPSDAPAPAAPRGGTPSRAAVVSLVVVAALAGVLSAMPAPATGEPRANRVPQQTKSFVAIRDHELSERWYDLLGTRDVCWRSYRHRETGREVVMTAVFHSKNWKSLHPPEVCLRASGFEMTGSEPMEVSIGDAVADLNRLELERRGVEYTVGYCFGSGDFTTNSYLSFFLHNLPRFVLRQQTQGFLLRVDIELPPGDTGDGSNQLLREFFAEFLPVIEKLLRSP